MNILIALSYAVPLVFCMIFSNSRRYSRVLLFFTPDVLTRRDDAKTDEVVVAVAAEDEEVILLLLLLLLLLCCGCASELLETASEARSRPRPVLPSPVLPSPVLPSPVLPPIRRDGTNRTLSPDPPPPPPLVLTSLLPTLTSLMMERGGR